MLIRLRLNKGDHRQSVPDTFNGDSGAVVGKHRVVVIDIKAALMGTVRRASKTKDKKGDQLTKDVAKHFAERQKSAANMLQVPPSYADFHKTPLRVEVRSGAQVIDLEIK